MYYHYIHIHNNLIDETLHLKTNPYLYIYTRRLNKIGKNPNLLAHREEDLGSESKTINAVVNALAAEADHVNMSDESVARLHASDRSLQELGRTLQKLTALPRPKSENNFASQDMPLTRGSTAHDDDDDRHNNGRPSFHKSDTFHKESAFQ